MSYDRYDLGQLRIPAPQTQYQGSVPVDPQLRKSAERSIKLHEDQFINQQISPNPTNTVGVGGSPQQVHNYWHNPQSPDFINNFRRGVTEQENRLIQGR